MKKYNFDSSEARKPASDFFGINEKHMLSISACAIMRDEIAHAKTWLDNVRKFASEIIVADTGSQDGTREFLAQQADVKLICCEWQHDFAQAKNMALREAKGDWIVFTDADECFYQPENIKVYLKQIGSKHVDVVFCPIDNIDADTDELIGSDAVPRIMRNHVGINYMGAVHEQLTNGSEPWQNIEYILADRKLAIRHTGYSAKVIAKKHKRNYEILKQVMANSNNLEMYYGFLSESLLGLGMYQEALENAILAMESPYQPAIQKERFAQVAVEAMDKLGLRICDIFPLQQAEKICSMVLERNKWHEGTLCQWLDIKIQSKSTNILEVLNTIYGDSTQNKIILFKLLQKNGYILLAEQFAGDDSFLQKSTIDMSEIYQFISAGEAARAVNMILPKTLQAQQMLFIALLGMNYSSSTSYQESLHLLPKVCQTLVSLYHGHTNAVILSTDDYTLMLQPVLNYGSKEMLEKYLKLSNGMPGECLKSIAFMLIEHEHYAEALNLLGQIQADDETVDDMFWLYCGKCLYYLDEHDSAIEALHMAREHGCDTAELSAYETWCREAKKI